MVKKTLTICVVVGLLAGTRTASAEISPALLASLLEEIQVLLKRVQTLQGEVELLRPERKMTAPKMETPESELKLEFSRPLSRGARGGDVQELQKFLARNPELYPEGVISGYFGFFTERALKKFQMKYALEATGFLDVPTRAKMRGETPPPQATPKQEFFKTPTAAARPQTPNPLDTLEQELHGVQKGTFLSPEHAERIYNDLATLETKGHPKDKIESLRNMVIGLSPHLQDTNKKETTSAPAKKICPDTIPILTADITDISKVRAITAPGSSSSEGPKGHSFVWTEHERVPIYAPTAVTFDSGSYSKDTEYRPAQYLLIFEVKDNCNYQIKFAHIDDPVPAIKEQLPAIPAIADSRGQIATKKIEFQTGDVIGYTAGTNEAGNWDFGLYNLKEKGVLATQYNSYGLHGYAVCWVDFYAGEKQTKYRRLLEGPKLLCSF